MKKLNLKIVGTIACSLITISSFSQNWRLGGNSNLPQLNNPANQSIGTNINRPIFFETNGVQRMLIESGNATTTDGRVALFNTLPLGFVTQDRLHLHQDSRGPMMRFTNNIIGFGAAMGLG